MTAGAFGSIQVNDNGSYVYTLTKPVDTEARCTTTAPTPRHYKPRASPIRRPTTTETPLPARSTIAIVDDTPTAVANSRAVVEGTQQSADVQFIVDLSGSMFASGGGGVGFDVPRLQ